MTTVYALTGATGAVGGRVAARLAGRGSPVRLIVRDPGRAPRLRRAASSPPWRGTRIWRGCAGR